MTRLQERYDSEVKPALMQEFGYKNALQVPRLDKIVVNIGVGEAVQDAKKIDAAVNDPHYARTAKSIARSIATEDGAAEVAREVDRLLQRGARRPTSDPR